MSRAVRAALRWTGRAIVSSLQDFCIASCRLAGVPMDDDLSAPRAPAPPEPEPGREPQTLNGPPPGHPERLVPSEYTLSPAEWEIWCQLGGVIRWP